jgi:hypothetical protein
VALIYHRPDGGILAHIPGDVQSDPDFESMLRDAHIPFRTTSVADEHVPMHMAVDAHTGLRVKVAAVHNHVLRRDEVEQDDGSVVERHFFHHESGMRRIFRKRVLRAAAAVAEDPATDDVDVTDAPAPSATPAPRTIAGGSDGGAGGNDLSDADVDRIARRVHALATRGGLS